MPRILVYSSVSFFTSTIDLPGMDLSLLVALNAYDQTCNSSPYTAAPRWYYISTTHTALCNLSPHAFDMMHYCDSTEYYTMTVRNCRVSKLSSVKLTQSSLSIALLPPPHDQLTILSTGPEPDCTSALSDSSIACAARHGAGRFRFCSVERCQCE